MRPFELLVGTLAFMMVPLARPHAQMPATDPIQIENVAERLGVKLAPSALRELELGKSVTGVLDDAKRIDAYGIKTMHSGARVTITYVGPGRLRVEADEMDPVPHNEVVVLQVAPDGHLTVASNTAKPASKPPL